MQRSIETVSLFVLIGLAVLRPLITESFDPAGGPFTAALDEIADPTPVATLVFDVLILLSACGWLLARAIGPFPSHRRTGLEWGLALLVIAAAISCLYAGNQRLAVNASIDCLCQILGAIVLVQLLRRPWQRRLLLAAVLASACVQATQCLDQSIGFDDTWDHYQAIRSEFWEDQSVELDSSRVELFERRMLAQETTGFLPHSNVTGSYLVLCGLAGLGLVGTMWRKSNSAIAWVGAAICTLAVVGIVAATVTTKSRGAYLSGSVGLLLWLLTGGAPALVAVMSGTAGAVLWQITQPARQWIELHRMKILVVGWICVLVGGAAVVGYGTHRGTLPGSSLAFRWEYWRTSGAMIADHPLTGVGRENFGRHYLRYKPIESPEEVANPHNLLVQVAAEYGILGVIGIAVMLVGGSLALCGPPARREEDNGPGVRGDCGSGQRVDPRGPARPVGLSRGRIFLWGGVLTIVATVGRIPLLGSDDPNLVYYSTVTTGLIWIIAFAAFAGGTGSAQPAGFARGSSVVITGVVIGLFTFLLHDMINFAMFVPGASTTFLALLAYGIAERRGDDSESPSPPRGPTTRWLPVAATAILTIAVVAVALVPVARAGHLLAAARDAAALPVGPRISDHPADRLFIAAALADPLDPTPYASRAGWLMAVAKIPQLREDAWRLAEKTLTAAVDRDPHRPSLHRMLANLHLDRAEAGGHHDGWAKAIESARAALALYPQDPAGVAALADCQLRAGRALASSELLSESIAGYERALALDEKRPEWETLRRFRRREAEEIRANINEARRELQREK